ncbi:hypothetical protein [Kitasatospora aureofaciens]|uniref:hypothetical protein n=1 Tax=Kitasatospora aureofaciens TaxID=1894 RepID=UPI00052598FE|nr:hypothetical protein [Kitasatospora aureofaciens]HJD82323.1 hypothetical protein [Kitasatospora aureofaciens]
MDRKEPVEQPQGPLTAFGGRLALDPDARTATVDGRAVPLTYQDVRGLRTLIELGEGLHDARDVLLHGWGAWTDPRELRYPMAVLRAKLGEPWWIVRDGDRYGLRPPGPPPSGRLPYIEAFLEGEPIRRLG